MRERARQIRNFVKDAWPAMVLTAICMLVSTSGWRSVPTSEADTALVCQLDRRLPEIRMEAVAFGDAMDFMSKTTDVRIEVDWAALAEIDVSPRTPVTVRLKNFRSSKALGTVLQDAGGPSEELRYYTSNGKIIVTTQRGSARGTVRKMYDLRMISLSGWNCFGPPNSQAKLDYADPAFAESIQLLIRGTVDTNTWTENGGSCGRMNYCDGRLEIWQLPENHIQIKALVDQLSETQTISLRELTELLERP